MDKVTLSLSRAELSALRMHLDMVCSTQTPSQLRADGVGGGFVYECLRMRATLLARLLVRLNITSVMVKDKYRVHIPVEQCFALLAEWHEPACASQRMGVLRVTVGRIDQALA
ncbi:MAG: hypothetical protein ABI432_08735 [Flavobacteriales bacterium]